MALKERRLTDWEIYDLLIRIDEGYITTTEEKRMLRSITSIEWSYSDLS